MSRASRIISGVGIGYASQLLAMIVGLWLTPFLLFSVGQHDYGLWVLGTQIIIYLGLLDIGVVAVLPRETAHVTGRAAARGESPTTELPMLIGQTARVVLWQWPLVAAAAAAAWVLLPSGWEGLRHPLSVVLAVFVLMFPLRIFPAVLQGLQDIAFLGKLNMSLYLASTAVTVALVAAGFGLYALAVGWAMLQLLAASACWLRLRRRFPGVLPGKLPPPDRAAARGRLRSGGWMSINQIVTLLITGTDIVIIGALFGPAAVVPFVCTGKLIGVMANQPMLLLQLSVPALSQMREGESRERIRQAAIALGQAVLLASGAVVCVVLAVNQGFVTRWTGTEQYGGFILTALTAAGMLLRHWYLTLGVTAYCFGHERRLALTALADALVSVAAMSLLIWRFGLVGAPLGAIMGVCLVSIPATMRVLSREMGTSVWGLARPFLPWFVRFGLVAFAASAWGRARAPRTVWEIGLMAVAVGLAYALLMSPLLRREPLGLYVRPRLRSLWAKLARVRRPRATALSRRHEDEGGRGEDVGAA